MKEDQRKLFHRITIAGSLVFTMIVSAWNLPIQQLYANEYDSEIIPETNIVLQEEGKAAQINFLMDRINKDKYDIQQLTAKGDDQILYEKGVSTEITPYTVEKNGTYEFQINYQEIKKAQPEPKEKIAQRLQTSENKEPSTEPTSLTSDEKSEEANQIKETEFKVTVDQIKPIQQQPLVEEMQTEEQKQMPPMTLLSSSSNLQRGLSQNRANGNIVDLNGEFDVSAIAFTNGPSGKFYGDSSYISIANNTAKLSDSQAAWSMQGADARASSISQVTSFTSKYQVDFQHSWVLDGNYFQPFVADGFTITFHNTPGYKASESVGDAKLGVYGPTGIGKGMVFEIDTFGYNNYGDTNFNGRAGAHMQIMEANGTDSPVTITSPVALSSGSASNPTTDVLGQNSPFKVEYNATNKTIKWTYGSGTTAKIINYTFTSDQDIIDKMGTTTPYFTLACAMNYTSLIGGNNGSATSGNATLSMNDFTFTDMEPSVTNTEFILVDENGNDHENVSNTFAKSGDLVKVRLTIKNVQNSITDMKEILKVSETLDGATPLIPISGSAYYTDSYGLRIPITDNDIFGAGVQVVFPKNSVNAYVDYLVKIPDYLDRPNNINLLTKATIGQNGMSQKEFPKDLSIHSRPILTSNGSVIDHVFVQRKTTAQFNNGEIVDMFFGHMQTGLNVTTLLNLSDEAIRNMQYFVSNPFHLEGLNTNNPSMNIDIYDYNSDNTKTYLSIIRADQMAMYYNLVEVYDTQFNTAGYTTQAKNPNGTKKILRRVYIGDNYAANHTLHGISDNFDITEITLAKMDDAALKQKLLDYIQIYQENASIDGNHNLVGSTNATKQGLSISNITKIEGIAPGSIAKSDPYQVNVTFQLNGATIVIPIKITVLESEPSYFVSIPAQVDLKGEGGINGQYAGKKASIDLIGEIHNTDRVIQVDADDGYALKDSRFSDQYIVDLYSDAGTRLTTNAGVANIGQLSMTNKELIVWMNAKKLPNQKGYYKGVMNVYLSFR